MSAKPDLMRRVINTQCCQLFAELFGQYRRKIQPLRKKIRSPGNFHFLKDYGLKQNTIFTCVSKKIR
jgi:hypothetical protein